jgi:uncharacterized membrane protein (DUF4010 family)
MLLAPLVARGSVPPDVAGIGAVLASLTSALVNVPLVARVSREHGRAGRITWGLGIIIALGIVGAMGEALLPVIANRHWGGRLREST